MGTLKIMDGTGDFKVVWNRENADEVEVARASFDKMLKKGYAAYGVKKGGDKKDRVYTFDPDSEAIIMAAPMAGG